MIFYMNDLHSEIKIAKFSDPIRNGSRLILGFFKIAYY